MGDFLEDERILCDSEMAITGHRTLVKTRRTLPRVNHNGHKLKKKKFRSSRICGGNEKKSQNIMITLQMCEVPH